MKQRSLLWVLVTFATLAPSAFCADWNSRLAADYLDSREKEWFAWPGANKAVGGPCISCHTNMTYLLARPALRHALGEKQATQYEQGLLDAMRARKPPSATVDHGFSHSVACMMAAEAYSSGSKQYWDTATETILDRAPGIQSASV